MKPWEEGDGAVEKFLLIKNSWARWWLRVSCATCAAHPVIPSYGMEFWDAGAVTTFPMCTFPNPIPLLWHGAFVSEGEGQKQKASCFWEVVFFSVWTCTKTTWILCKLLFSVVFLISVLRLWSWLYCFYICTITGESSCLCFFWAKLYCFSRNVIFFLCFSSSPSHRTWKLRFYVPFYK